ncbi:hypothetical protein PHLGIDRAFT_183488 [Phlebiopsis gigantea 11061_1 CR5-6]|uniref:C2H2-type domain-containing protein n=1 Tax=Phlebiopsis gigantea (strain 11061_1 CR5-6) TaxID=745531 RepID=A0A0C3NIH2_PHLG1|nr:hypothetical protein PHLGIDRAFT_183488 [Phlebiopsis gigantea 11061_1 CR5-6]
MTPLAKRSFSSIRRQLKRAAVVFSIIEPSHSQMETFLPPLDLCAFLGPFGGKVYKAVRDEFSAAESPTGSTVSSPVLGGSRHPASRTCSRDSSCGGSGPFVGHSLPHSPPPGLALLDDTASNSKKRYQCEVCYRRFERPSSLETHMNSHTGARPHICPLPGCTKAFTTRSNMQRHFRSHDPRPLPYSPA